MPVALISWRLVERAESGEARSRFGVRIRPHRRKRASGLGTSFGHGLTLPYMGRSPWCVPVLRVVNHTRSGCTCTTTPPKDGTPTQRQGPARNVLPQRLFSPPASHPRLPHALSGGESDWLLTDDAPTPHRPRRCATFKEGPKPSKSRATELDSYD